MSIEEKIDEVLDLLRPTRSDAIESLQYSIEVLAAAMREAGLITDEHIRAAHKKIRKENEERKRAAEMKERLHGTLGPAWGSFIRNF